MGREYPPISPVGPDDNLFIKVLKDILMRASSESPAAVILPRLGLIVEDTEMGPDRKIETISEISAEGI